MLHTHKEDQVARCRICGKYNDIFEYPEEQRGNYKPGLCYSCYVESLKNDQEDDQPEDENTGYCEPEAEDDPEIDDTPDLPDDNSQEEEVSDDQESDALSDEERNIQNIKRMLFG